MIIILCFSIGFTLPAIFPLMDIITNHMDIDLDEQQILFSVCFIPVLFKILYGITVDAKLIAKRKYYLVICNLVISITSGLIGSGKYLDAFSMSLNLFFFVFAGTFFGSVT